MCSDIFMLNNDKTEFIIIGTWQQLSKVKISGDYWGDFDYCDSIAIVGSTIAILLQ